MLTHDDDVPVERRRRKTSRANREEVHDEYAASMSRSSQRSTNNGNSTYSAKNNTENILMGNPNFPRLHRRGKNGSLRMRLMIMQLKSIGYILASVSAVRHRALVSTIE